MAEEAEKSSAKKLSKASLLKGIEVFKYIKPNLIYFFFAMLMLVTGSLIFLVIIKVIGEMVNVATGEATMSYDLNQLGMALIGMVIIQALFSFLRTYFFAIVSENGIAVIRQELYEKLITQPILFFENERVGDLISRITTDIEQVQAILSHSLAEFIRQIVILVGGIAFLAYTAPRLALIMLMTFPIVVVGAMFFGRYIRRLSRKRQKRIADSANLVNETFQNFLVVKSFTAELFESKKYKNITDDVVKVSLRFARIRGVFFAFVIALLFGCILFILFRGAQMVQSGEMPAGDLVSFSMFTAMLGGAIAGLGNLYATLLGSLGATERVFEILDKDQELNLTNSKEENNRFQGEIEFRKTSFAYPAREDIKVLDGINIHVQKGKKIALVGQSGSGKTTIAKLIMRLYDVNDGSITIDGKKINEYDVTHLRQNIGIVPQEVLLFGGSIKENILYGDQNATEEEIIAAATKANAMEFIEKLPDGLDTIIGERGVKLSGGQRQRIAIARALLNDPSILILDEATSALDAESERLVQEALDVLMKGRTSIIIAHRLATIRDVDRIYVMQDGKITEEGTHAELIEIPDGTYNQLAKLQFD